MDNQLSLDFLSQSAVEDADDSDPGVPVSECPAPSPAADRQADAPSHASGAALTLDTLIGRLRAHPDLAPTRKRDLVSAVRSYARLVGQPPSLLVADLRAVRQWCETFHPAQVRMSRKRFANLRADLAAALRLVRPAAPGRRPRVALTAAWQALSDLCPTPKQRWELSRFLGWASAHRLAPAEVRLEHIERFVAEVDATQLNVSPQDLRRQTVAAWNRCSREVPAWPAPVAKPPPARVRWTLALDELPVDFRADLERWLSLLAGGDPFADDAPARPLRPATLVRLRKQVLTAATALVRSGLPLDSLHGLVDLVTTERQQQLLRHLLERYGKKTDALHQLATMLRSIARNWAKLPETDLQAQRRFGQRLAMRRSGMTRRNAERLRKLNQGDHLDMLITLPQSLMRRAARLPPLKAARVAQTAVMLEILLMKPLRLGNLAGLRLGSHVLLGPGPDGPVEIVIDGTETKNAEPIEHAMPRESARLVRRYIERYLPVLARPGNNHLFPGKAGLDGKSHGSIRQQFEDAVREATGCEVHPHLMRHIDAMLHLEAHPGEYEVVRRFLSNKSMHVTSAVYCGMEDRSAARHFDKGMLERRRAAERNLALRLRERHHAG